MAADFKFKTTQEGKNFQKQLEELTKLEVAVGYQQGKAEHDGTDIADIAMFNEFGTVHIPSRPFMRDSFDKNEERIAKYVCKKAEEMINGKKAEDILKEIGVYQTGLVKKEIRNGSFVPNEDSTKRKKKSDKPLIDTGRMRQSVNYVIREKGDFD